MSEDLSQLTPGQRVTVGVIAGMLTNEPAACAADVDNAIAATATVGAPEFARTRQERAEHIGAIQASGQQAIAETKPKVTRAEALEQVKLSSALSIRISVTTPPKRSTTSGPRRQAEKC